MKFFKRPHTVDALQYDGENEEEIYEAFGREPFLILGDSDSFMLNFKNAHGDEVYARPGDWIVHDPEYGTLEAVTAHIMTREYDPIEEGETDGSSDQ